MAAPTAGELKRKAKVRSATDLRGVPAGTWGKVSNVTQGVTWTRYWVDFDNGALVGSLDRSKLSTPKEWDDRGKVAVVVDAPTDAAGGDGGAPTAPPEDTGGIPAHLLERSRKRREALAAKAG